MRIKWRWRPFEIFMVVSLLGWCGLIMLIALAKARDSRYSSLCMGNMKSIQLATWQYLRDYDEVHPLRTNWATALQPYHKDPAQFHCPAAVRYGYAMNKNLHALNISRIWNVEQTPLFFETSSNRPNANGTSEAWLLKPRHLIGIGVIFEDGHLKYVKTPPKFESFVPKTTTAMKKSGASSSYPLSNGS